MRRTRFCSTSAMVVVCLLVAACSSEPEATPAAASPSSPPASPAPTRTVPASAAHDPAVRATVRTLRDYLDTWVADGPAVAMNRYLHTRLRLTGDDDLPRLVSGSVESVEVWRWHGPDRFLLLVTMDLRFVGPRYAWDQGSNTRFVRPHRRGPDGPIRLELSTGP